MKTRGATRYPVIWFKASRKKAMVAVCGRTRQPFFITPTSMVLRWLTMSDLYADDTQCEEAQRCMNGDCPLNRTTPESLFRSFGIERVPRWAKRRPLRIGRLAGDYEKNINAEIDRRLARIRSEDEKE